MIWLSFANWHSSSGRFFTLTRIYSPGWRWTPFVRVRKRYRSWFGFWGRA
jgi:hypothetical protein